MANTTQPTSSVVRTVAAIAGAGALAVMGTLAVTTARHDQSVLEASGGPATVTSTTPPSTPLIAFASPTVTATYSGKH
ncbi:hypothetical protein [Mycolicibacterium phocaicum]|uniref:Uncharacterized protein n=1 Tax=Mycolicibacterium phocaicum TaxID=319706 RepID=A0A7I7ZS92_9MYCO|nr:hypothetical protein [Mycolicibacterium phocaicum]TLH60365.1 hypothetical protein C1S79_26275 [Mycolicibacterium phocaicum]BBZ56970.1 hypothetical protein MPHO_39620 [Mycolicibacterium phocaicum]